MELLTYQEKNFLKFEPKNDKIFYRRNFDCFRSDNIQCKLLFLSNQTIGEIEYFFFKSLLNSFIDVFDKKISWGKKSKRKLLGE